MLSIALPQTKSDPKQVHLLLLKDHEHAGRDRLAGKAVLGQQAVHVDLQAQRMALGELIASGDRSGQRDLPRLYRCCAEEGYDARQKLFAYHVDSPVVIPGVKQVPCLNSTKLSRALIQLRKLN